MSIEDDQIDSANINWEEQDAEMEALEVIFPDEIEVTSRQPYKFQIQINSNAEVDDNHLKMLLKVDLGYYYPQKTPDYLVLKNLSPDYLDNQMLDAYETEIQAMAREMIGDQMMFNLCDHLREKIAEINDQVVDKFNKILDAQAEEDALAKGPKRFDTNNLNYTPVNHETFGAWCTLFMEKMKKQDLESQTEIDKRLSGKEWFKVNKAKDFDDFTVEEEEVELEDDLDIKFEEEKLQDDEPPVQEGALYDKNLFAEELGDLDDEDVDFD